MNVLKFRHVATRIGHYTHSDLFAIKGVVSLAGEDSTPRSCKDAWKITYTLSYAKVNKRNSEWLYITVPIKYLSAVVHNN